MAKHEQPRNKLLLLLTLNVLGILVLGVINITGLTIISNLTKETITAEVSLSYDELPSEVSTSEEPIIMDGTADRTLYNLIADYASTHEGTYRVSIQELEGAKQHISYNGDQPIITASTYKVFVAYSTLLKIQQHYWSWDTTTYDGRNVETCFTIMLTESNNECAEALLNQMSFETVQTDAANIGASLITFEPYNIHSTADDETLLLGKLATNQLPLTFTNQRKLIDTMTANIYREGIPAGVLNITVADKVGFQNELLHDTAIIYSPNGAYVLTILTENSSWANIAELTQLIEAGRESLYSL